MEGAGGDGDDIAGLGIEQLRLQLGLDFTRRAAGIVARRDQRQRAQRRDLHPIFQICRHRVFPHPGCCRH